MIRNVRRIPRLQPIRRGDDEFPREFLIREQFRRMHQIGRRESQPAEFANRAAEGELGVTGERRQENPRGDGARADVEGGIHVNWINISIGGNRGPLAPAAGERARVRGLSGLTVQPGMRVNLQKPQDCNTDTFQT